MTNYSIQPFSERQGEEFRILAHINICSDRLELIEAYAVRLMRELTARGVRIVVEDDVIWVFPKEATRSDDNALCCKKCNIELVLLGQLPKIGIRLRKYVYRCYACDEVTSLQVGT